MSIRPGYPCAVCRRAGGAIQIHIEGKRLINLCSTGCGSIYMALGEDLTTDEAAAAAKGGEVAGELLDKMGKTDLATLTEDEWGQFCRALFRASCDELRRVAKDQVPF